MSNVSAGERQATRVEPLARLRALVAYLGEKDQFGWWPTSALSQTGRRFLEYNFPRTTLSAGVQAASHAAMRSHDERIGRQGAFHLFRLPHALERDVHAQLTGSRSGALAALLEGRDVALAALRELAGQESAAAVGPVRVSNVAQILHRPSIRKVAAIYHGAFTDGAQSFPYYTRE